MSINFGKEQYLGKIFIYKVDVINSIKDIVDYEIYHEKVTKYFQLGRFFVWQVLLTINLETSKQSMCQRCHHMLNKE